MKRVICRLSFLSNFLIALVLLVGMHVPSSFNSLVSFPPFPLLLLAVCYPWAVLPSTRMLLFRLPPGHRPPCWSTFTFPY